MASELPVLDQIRVASPCTASWDRMEGDDRARYCGECRKHVYHLSSLTRAEAEALIREKEGRLCARFYRRRDGTVLTADCPVGRSRMRRALLAHSGGITAIFLCIPGVAWAARQMGDDSPFWDLPGMRPIGERLGLVQPKPVLIVGDIAMPAPPASSGG